MPNYTRALEQTNYRAGSAAGVSEVRVPEIDVPNDSSLKKPESPIPELSLDKLVRRCVNAAPYELSEDKLGDGE